MSQVPLGGGRNELRGSNGCTMRKKSEEAERKLEEKLEEHRGSM